MSLKAKLEAVIYAAEEPVTLAQLSILFAGEALAWKAERAAAESLNFPPEPEVESSGDGSGDAPDAVELAESGVELGAELTGMLLLRDDGYTVAEAVAAAIEETPVAQHLEVSSEEPASEVSAEDAELEAKRAARQREREVREILRGVLDELIAEYASSERGIEIREIAGGYRMATKPECHDSVRSFIKSLKPALKLSLPALETLAVIAYKQPVTAPEVGEIRGVDSAGVLGSLMSRKLITTAGRKPVVGRPMLYKTTREFLLRFGLKDISELPSMEEFEKLAAVELSENEELDFPSEENKDAAAEENVRENGESFEDMPIPEPQPLRDTSNHLDSVETITTAAETSKEAAEAPVERQDAQEIEAEA